MITVKKDALKIKTPEGMQNAGVLCNVGVLWDSVRTGEIILADNAGFLEIETGINAKYFLIKAEPYNAVINTGVRAISMQFWDFDAIEKCISLGTNSTGVTVNTPVLPQARAMPTIDANGKIMLNNMYNTAGYGYFVPSVTYKWYAW